MKMYLFISCIYAVLSFCSCSKFLEVKPDIKMVIPKSLTDAELLLNDYSTMNTGYPIYGEWSTDEYYLSPQTFDGKLSFDQRSTYTWSDVIYDDASQWQRPYKAIFNTNEVFEIVHSNVINKANAEQIKTLEGTAHFFRAFALQQLVEVFAPVFQTATARVEMGLPLRLSPAIDEQSSRASVGETYDQIIEDYKKASERLSVNVNIKGKPSRASAYAGLARTYLTMSDFEKAYRCADSSLALQGELMDFSELKASSSLPVPKFNKEVIFAAVSATAGPMNLTNGLVDSMLYESYEENDLRKLVFFRKNITPLNSYGYKGSYDNSMANLFVGLTTSEMYLIKAEAGARTGKIDNALQALNTLRRHRYAQNRFIPITERDPVALLAFILEERRKELVFRGRRWSDLKRLNLEARFQKTLKREMHGKNYTLEPNSRKYAYRLSEVVINNGKIPQNIR